ncbi:MAG: bifunctional ADP-heptose synthase [Longimicrobiales bacterium]
MDRVDAARARELLDRMAGSRILVVGDLMLDVYLRGGASRISPEAPVPVVHVKDEWHALGGAANVAANLAALGVNAALIGVVGEDWAGGVFRDVARDVGIAVEDVVTLGDRPTTVKTRVLVGHQQVARYDREDTRDLTERIEELEKRVEAAADGADAIILEDYNKGVLVPGVIDVALDIARRRDLPIVVDPKARHFFDFPGCTVFKPNHPELAAALRAEVRPDNADWMARTRKHLECENLLVTRGGEGMSLATAAGELLHVPAVARAVYDVSGAGDTVTAVMAATLAASGAVDEAAVLATHAAGAEVGKAGVVTVSPEEIIDSVRRHDGTASAE